MMPVSVFSLYIAIISIRHSVAAFAGIDYNVCNPLNATVIPPPPPELAISFSTKIEWKWLDTNTTVDITEYYNGITDMGSLDMYIEGQEVKILYDYKESQYILYTQADGCSVDGLGTLAFYDNKLWLTAFKLLYSVAKRSDVQYLGQVMVRSTRTEKFRTCLYLYQFNITVQMDMFFSSFGWGMALSRPDEMIPVRLEMHGSVTYNNTKAGIVPFHVVGDFIDYNPRPVADQTIMQVPSGTFCPGRLSRKPMNLLPTDFSMVLETIDMDYQRITYESIWFDSVKRLVRRDYKEASGSDPDPTTEIFDFNLGVHYSIDPYMGNCDPVSNLNLGDLFVAYNGNSTIRMMTSSEYFHVAKAQVQYVGTRVTRGVTCDVWVGLYLDDEANRNFTIEWYFTTMVRHFRKVKKNNEILVQDNWIEAVGGIIQPASLFRIDIWQGGSDKPLVRNVLQMNTEAPQQDVFDVAQCFPSPHYTRLLVHFAVVNNGSLDTVSASYLKDVLHVSLVQAAFLPPLRIAGVTIEFVGTSDVYFDAILLDNAPMVNPRIIPPAPEQHSLQAALEFLKGVIGGRFKLSVNSTTVKIPVILESRGLLQIDYKQEFTTTPATTTTTTTEATPPIPQQPTTEKPLIPTKIRTPPTLASTQSPTPCVCPQTSCSTAKTLVISPSSCPTDTTQNPTTQTQCPKVTCPTKTPCPVTKCTSPPPTQSCSTITQALLTKCPTIPQQTPCPSLAPLKFSRCPTVPPVSCSPATGKTNAQQGNNQQNTSQKSGLSGGAVAGIAIFMLIVGLLGGVGFVIAYRRYRVVPADRRNILDKYLDNEDKY